MDRAKLFRASGVLAIMLLAGAGCVAPGGDGGGDADVAVAEEGLRKGTPGAVNGQPDYCDSPANPCVSGEGDCDADFQCTGAGIVCGRANGLRFGIHRSLDTCWPASCQNGVLDPGEVEIDNGGPCGCTVVTYYYDYDADGWGTTSNQYCSGTQPANWVAQGGDCAGTDPTRNPGATEICGDGIDQDCDGTPDDGCVSSTWCVDNDGDSYPRSTGCRTQSTRPGYNWIAVDGATVYDCDDTRGSVYPGAGETCNSVDDDCDGTFDEGAQATWYVDNEYDGYPRSSITRLSCTAPGPNWVVEGSFSEFDCDDGNPAVNPGALEVCGDGIDNDCSGAADTACVPSHCFNAVQDGNETGVDCGGFCDVCSVGATPTSCAGVPATCGPTGTDDCCAGETVFGADYYRSYDGVGFTDMSAPATVYSYVLDDYEVTVARFRAFVQAYDAWRGAGNPTVNAGEHPLIPGTGWQSTWTANLPADAAAFEAALASCATYIPTYTSTAGANDSLPVTCVTWFQALAFCAWDGGRLPTEAEFNLAAAGGAEQRVYPWSSPPSDASIDAQHAAYACSYDGDGSSCSISDIAEVGGAAAGRARWGHYDLSGNAWEWVFDRFAATYATPCTNCADSTTITGFRAIRGGGYPSGEANVRAGARSRTLDTDHSGSLGFRCARGG